MKRRICADDGNDLHIAHAILLENGSDVRGDLFQSGARLHALKNQYMVLNIVCEFEDSNTSILASLKNSVGCSIAGMWPIDVLDFGYNRAGPVIDPELGKQFDGHLPKTLKTAGDAQH